FSVFFPLLILKLMDTQKFKKFIPHLVAVVIFIVAAVAYFNPVLQGKVIYQSDIVQYNGMAKQQNDFRKEKGEETYWTNSAFGGMPTYQLGRSEERRVGKES